MNKKIGFIGMGNMASAIALGVMQAEFLQGYEIYAYDPYPKQLDILVEEYGVQKQESAFEVAKKSDIIILAVKPDMIENVLEQIQTVIDNKAVVSIALGWLFSKLSSLVPQSTRIQALMPNTPMQVQDGVCLFEETNTLTSEELNFIKRMFESVGTIEVLPTHLMGIGGTLSGCGPAYTYLFIEALADAAVYHGLNRQTAYLLASQMVLGSAKMVLETQTHPGQLKDNVCSPGGSTIRGVTELEKAGFRNAVIEAIHKSMGK